MQSGKKVYIYLLLMISFLIWNQNLYSQTIVAKASIRADHLLPEEQEILGELPRQIEDYINNYEWTGEDKDIYIEATINIIVETITQRGSDKVYRAQFLIGSPSGENFYDRNCEFTYQRGQYLSHQQGLFDPLTALIDFYVYMVIAGELDTYELLAGTPYYDQAMNIANQGIISNFPYGWDQRLDEVKTITDADHRPLREAKFYYYECLYNVEELKNKDRARELSKKVVDLLEQVYNRRPNSKALKRFFDSHYQEFCELFTFDENRFNVRRLMNIDNRHRETYEKCL